MDAGRGRLVDVALAVVASGSALAAMVARLEPEAREPDALAYALIVALGAPMLVRRQRPGLALAVTVGVLVVYYALGYSAVGFAVPLAPALFSVAEAGRWRSGASTGLFVLTVATCWRLYDENEDRVIVGYDLATTLAVMAAVIAWGDAVRSRREWQRELARRMAAAEVEREREAERRVADERLRIARDVHDVVGHTVAVISIQADVASEALDDDLPTTRSAIETIRRTSRQALGDLRDVMGLLRGDAGEHVTAEPDATGPTPGLAQLARLVAAARTEQLRADLRVEGVPFPLPSPVDTTAHRVVQEALTNVIRHADASVVEVVVRYLDRSVELRDHRRRPRCAADLRRLRSARDGAAGAPAGRVGHRGQRARGRLRRPCRPARVPGGAGPRSRPVIRVLLVDDQPLVREGLRAVIGRDPERAVAGEAENGQDALRRLREVGTDVVLMDIRMPVMDGIEATRKITSDGQLGHVRVVALTTFDTDDFLFRSLRAGASGFLLKDSEPQEVRRAIKVVAAGDALLSPGVTRRVMEAAAASSRPDPAPLRHLTEREQEVLAAVGEGLDNLDIGRRLFISPDTVRTHVGRIIAKLGARDRAQSSRSRGRRGSSRPARPGPPYAGLPPEERCPPRSPGRRTPTTPLGCGAGCDRSGRSHESNPVLWDQAAGHLEQLTVDLLGHSGAPC